MKGINTIWIPFVLLIIVGIVLVAVLAHPLEVAFGYPNLHYVFNHLVNIGIGVAILFVMSKLDTVWFDRIGAGVLVLTIIAAVSTLFYPEFHQGRVFVKIGNFSMQTAIYFTLGVVWIFDYSMRVQTKSMQWIVWFVSLVILGIWLILLVKMDMVMMLLIGLSVLGMLCLRYGMSKIFFIVMGSILGLYGFLLLGAPHRISRIQSWWEMLISGESLVPPTGMNLLIDRMHEGLFIYNEWGGMVLMLVTLLFTWLIINIWKVEGMFAKGVAIVLGLSIFFHIINFFGLSPMKPPALFIVGSGKSSIFVSFLMIAMVLMSAKQHKGEKYVK